ncbi:hypothetical protein C8F00_3162 [Xanthomonas vasicola]
MPRRRRCAFGVAARRALRWLRAVTDGIRPVPMVPAVSARVTDSAYLSAAMAYVPEAQWPEHGHRLRRRSGLIGWGSRLTAIAHCR